MTKNARTTLVSLRLENVSLKAIDKFIDNRRYLKRSAVINQALKKVFAMYRDRDIYDFLYNGKGLEPCDIRY